MNLSPLRSPLRAAMENNQTLSYPLPAYLNFVPGGMDYGPSSSNKAAPSSPRDKKHSYPLNHVSPEALVARAHVADSTLRKYTLRSQQQASATVGAAPSKTKSVPHRLPSLSILAEAAFGPLTGVNDKLVRKWADAMVLAYAKDDSMMSDDLTDAALMAEYDRLVGCAPPVMPNINSNSNPSTGGDLVAVLKKMHKRHLKKQTEINPSSPTCRPTRPRPCGYIFRRGDIAWNCRTCQSDSTCVLCDSCFHASDHEGHEVYFHRTSPGGCCDCGDIEAWKPEGCCPAHRPLDFTEIEGGSDSEDIPKSMSTDSKQGIEADFEAVKASTRNREDMESMVTEMLPESMAAALGVVIGAAVQMAVEAVDGAGAGGDSVQWTRRWSDQLRKLSDGCAHEEEYVLHSNPSCAGSSLSEAIKLPFPNRFKLQVRLHNDDVHTYDEVITALYQGQRNLRPVPPHVDAGDGTSETDTSTGLVRSNKIASDLTQHVDSDGQVIVRAYSTFDGAKAGFDRLKKRELHCSIISTPQVDLELRARTLLSWLKDISAAHPAVSALVVHALVDVTEGTDMIGNVLVWGGAHMLPPWSFSPSYLSSTQIAISEDDDNTNDSLPGWRRRMDVFAPHLSSSYLTREEARHLHSIGFTAPHDLRSPHKGKLK